MGFTAGKPCIFWGYHQFPVDSSWTFFLAKIKISAVASLAPYHFECMFSEWTQYVGIVVDFNKVWFCGGLVAYRWFGFLVWTQYGAGGTCCGMVWRYEVSIRQHQRARGQKTKILLLENWDNSEMAR